MKAQHVAFILLLFLNRQVNAAPLESANDFYLVRCQEIEPGNVSVAFSSLDGVKKNIFVNTSPKMGYKPSIVFDSNSSMYSKWILELSNVKWLTYSYKKGSDVGVLGLQLVKDDNKFEFGVINRSCKSDLYQATIGKVKMMLNVK
jgi:hypothetical protein